MAKKEQSDREIEELLNQLRDKTESDAQNTPEVSKKSKKMTDDDVKALLRKYYSDPETLPEEEPSKFEFDTSEFVSDTEKEIVEEIIEESFEEEIIEDEAVEELFEEEVVEENIQEVAEDDIEEPVQEEIYEEEIVEDEKVEEEQEEHIIEDQIVEELVTENEAYEDELIDEIIYDDIELDDSSFLFGLDDETEIEEETVETVEEKQEEWYSEEETVVKEFIEEESVLEEEIVIEEPVVEEETGEEIGEEIVEDSVESEITEDTVKDEFVEEIVIEEEPEEETVETVYVDDTPSESEDNQEWKPSEDVSGRLDDGELDLMVALGFGDKLRNKYGEERVRRAEEKQRLREGQGDGDITAYGYIGREFAKQSDIAKINAAFDRDRIKLIIRLIGTAVLTAIMFIFGNLGLLGVHTSGIFSISENPTGYTLVSLVLLLGTAAFSYKQLIDGFLFSIGRRKSGWVILTVSLVVLTVYDILVAIIAPPEAIIYDLPVAFGLLFSVFADYMDYSRERTTFKLLTENSPGLYALYSYGNNEDGRVCLNASRIQFVEGYFRRTGIPHDFSQLQLLSVIPVAAAGTLIAVVAAVSGQPLWKALSAVPAAFAFAAPLIWSFAGAWQQLKQTFKLNLGKSGIVGGRISDEYMNADCVIFDDEEAFSTKEVKVQNVRLFDNCDIYKTLYNVNALFIAVGGPLSDIMKFTASNLGDPKSVSLTGAADHYVEALVDKENTVCAGSANALAKRGIYIPKGDGDEGDVEGCSVMYAAINGEACARFCIKYTLNDSFKRTAETLASDGVGIRLRTLDPNIDRFLLFSTFGENVETSILREPHRDMSKESATVTAVFSRNSVKSLADPFVLGRRVRRLERAINIMRLVMMGVGITASALLIFFKCPVIYLPAAAVATQLVGLLPVVPIYFLGKGK